MMKVAAAAAAVIITLLVAMIETLITHYHDYSRQSNQQPTPNAIQRAFTEESDEINARSLC
jgi:hypothetical protein